MTIKEAINRANPNGLPDLLRQIKFGSLILGGLPQLRHKFNFDASGASARHQATLDHMPLAADGSAAVILRAYARAGAAGTGELAVQAFGVTPASGQIAVAPNGDIVTLAADALTDVDLYAVLMPLEEKVITLDVIPGTGVCALPASVTGRGVGYLKSALVTAGTVVGEKRILVPGAVNPATPSARLSVAKDAVHFTVADAVSKVTLTLAMNPEVDAYARLYEAETTA